MCFFFSNTTNASYTFYKDTKNCARLHWPLTYSQIWIKFTNFNVKINWFSTTRQMRIIYKKPQFFVRLFVQKLIRVRSSFCPIIFHLAHVDQFAPHWSSPKDPALIPEMMLLMKSGRGTENQTAVLLYQAWNYYNIIYIFSEIIWSTNHILEWG